MPAVVLQPNHLAIPFDLALTLNEINFAFGDNLYCLIVSVQSRSLQRGKILTIT
jgi:hypothetical protein